MNLALGDVGGAVLAVSQFTLYADTRKGNRPSFTDAAAPDVGEAVYGAYVEALRAADVPVETGIFGAHMQVELRQRRSGDDPARRLSGRRNGPVRLDGGCGAARRAGQRSIAHTRSRSPGLAITVLSRTRTPLGIPARRHRGHAHAAGAHDQLLDDVVPGARQDRVAAHRDERALAPGVDSAGVARADGGKLGDDGAVGRVLGELGDDGLLLEGRTERAARPAQVLVQIDDLGALHDLEAAPPPVRGEAVVEQREDRRRRRRSGAAGPRRRRAPDRSRVRGSRGGRSSSAASPP